MSGVEMAAVAAAVLLGVGAAFQAALALGAPLGAATMGGRAPTVDGVLVPRFRAFAAMNAVVLVIAAWVILMRANVLDRVVDATLLRWAAWIIVVFMAVNTLGNVGGRHPLERYGMASITLLVALLGGYVALRAPL